MESKKARPKNDEVQKHGQIQYTPLPVVESGLYWTVWISIVSYLMYTVYVASNEYKDYLYPEDLGEGWKIIGRKKDVSDMEWEFWLKFKYVFLVAYGLNFLGGLIMSSFFPKFRHIYYLVFTLAVLTAVIGIRPVLYLLVHCVLMYISALTGSVLLVWGTSLAILASLHFESIKQWQFQYLTDKIELNHFTLFVALMSILRCLSFCLDYCWREEHKDQQSHSYTFLDLLSFNFYLPLFNNGPVMTYNTFHTQIHQPHRSFTKHEILSITWDFVRTLFWFIFLEVYLHFIYSSALIQSAPVVRTLSGWAISGIFYSQLHIFLTKYVVMYGFAGLFARLDGLDPPKPPRCVSTLYTFTEMWRSFDRGLNIWMKRYIYIPMGGSHRGLFRQFFSSFLAFAYVWAWHGGVYDNMWWFVFNWMGVAIEVLASLVRNHPRAIGLQDCLSPCMRRRMHAMICVIPCSGLILSNLVFLIGPLPVQFYIQKIFYQDFPVSSLVCLSCLYLSVQTNIDLNYYKGGQW